MSKITCWRFVTYKVEDPKNIAIWISGYEHGKRGNTVLDVQRLMADADKLANYCVKNEDMPVMRAFETILSSSEQCIPACTIGLLGLHALPLSPLYENS